MDVQEICWKLKPIIGNKADRYWMAYLSEDYRGKQEIETVLRMMAARMLNSNLENKDVPLSAPPEHVASGPYPLGAVTYCDKTLHPFGLREDEWIQHTAVFGRSGAGKTNTVFHIIDNFLNQKKPFLIFDWKRNYRDMLAVGSDEIIVYTVGRGAVPFTFNPLIPPHGTDPATWLKKLIEIIAHSYYLGEGVMFLLQEALHAIYQEYGVYKGTQKEYPTFNDVYHWLEKHPVKGRKALWMDSAMRGIKSICFGHMGHVVNTSVQPNIAALLEKNVILELDSLTNADKTLIIESLLLWIHNYRLTQPDRETFKHAMIIEEAHHILLKRTGGRGGEAVTDTILREIRELGEAIVLVDQHPSLISIPALGNTYTTIAMNLKHKSDVSAIGAAMLLKDEELDMLGRLPIGTAIVKMQGRWLEPFLVKIPHKQIPKGAIDDAALIQLMVQRNVISPYQEIEEESIEPAPTPPQLSEKEEAFILDVLTNPLSGMVERYKRLHTSRRKGNDAKEACVENGLIEPVEIPTKSGRVVLLQLTDQGRAFLRGKGHEIPDRTRWGGLEHEYWKGKLSERLESDGWLVTQEVPVNGYTDIIAQKTTIQLAIEIETGKSDWRRNIEKNLKKGFQHILVVATNKNALDQISTEIKSNPNHSQIHTEQAQNLIEQQNLFPFPER
ncbi:ATP-binding protein [Candidatus Hydrogenedentota bacterium]